MTIDRAGGEAAWAAWSQALFDALFPAGLGPGERFAFGQTTLGVDFANQCPKRSSYEVFRVGDAVPSAAPGFVPTGSLSEAYGYFLDAIDSPQLARAKRLLQDANSPTQTDYNMAVDFSMAPPAGSGLPGPPVVPCGESAIFRPAYVLDSGFRKKYQEWQTASVDSTKQAGAVIEISGTVPGAAQPVGTRALSVPRSALPPFFRTLAAASAGPALAPVVTGARNGAWATLLPPGNDASTRVQLAAPGGSGDFSLKVSFTGLGTFMLGPAGWFSDTTVRLFQKQLPVADQTTFFAENGVLARRVSQVVIGFEPTVELRFDDPTMYANANAWVSQAPDATIAIGPLSFAAGRVASNSPDDKQTVIIGPAPSTLPILLGVLSTGLIAA